MSNSFSLSRREFVGALAATAVAGLSPPGHVSAPAASPITRTGPPRMKLSLAAYSFNRMLPRNWPKPGQGKPTMSLMDFVNFCAAQDLDACEPTSYYFPAVPDSGSPLRQAVPQDVLLQLKEQTFRLGLDISGTAIGNDFCLPEGPERDFELKMTRLWIDYAAVLGAPVIRIFAGKIPPGDTEQAALDRCVAGINESLEYAAEKGVVLGLENHGGITATSEQLLAIVERVENSPWFGVNFDSGNFQTADPYADLERIAPYTVNAQVKCTIRRGAGAPAEETDFERVIGILNAAGYRGYVALEYEEKDDPYTAIPTYLSRLRDLIGT